MNLTHSDIRCCLQVALLGAITANLRAVCVEVNKASLSIFFYYASLLSPDEEELSEIVVTEVYSDFLNIPELSVEIKRIVLPLPNPIPKSN